MATLNALVNRVCEQLEVTVEEGGLAAKVRACATAAGIEYTTLQATARLLAVEVLGEAAPAAPSTPAAAPAPAPAGAPEATAPAPRLRPWCLTVEKNCGFGSVHYLRDVGDAAKVSEAVAAKEADGQETCSDPVVIVGGGILTMELAAKVARFRGQKVPVTVVLSRDRIMPKVFREDIAPEAGSLGAKDVAEFYERQLIKCGVKFVREHRCLRLWDVDESGEFPTMEGPAISLQRTRPRRFACPATRRQGCAAPR